MPPDFTTLSKHLLFYMQGSITSELARYLIGAGGVTLVLWLGRRALAHRRIQTRRAVRGDIVREVRQSLWTIVVFAVVDLMTTVALARGGAIPVDTGTILPLLLIAQVAALAVLHDAWFYWMHRALHRPKLFRLTHLAHHRSRTPTSWAAYSFATGEAVTEALAVPAILLIVSHVTPICPVGVYPLAVIVFLGHQIARNAIGHSGHELAWSGFTRSRWTGWLTTTTHHDLHHSEGRYNYGLYFTWWDRWMGTEHPRYHDRFEAVVTRASQQAGDMPQGFTPSSG
jgi:Delta7-sterol 5-desaturase